MRNKALEQEKSFQVTIPVTPERKAQLESSAQLRGKDAATVLDDMLASYLAAEQPHRLNADEFAAALDALTDDIPERPPIPAEALRRENLYPVRFQCMFWLTPTS